MSATHEGTCIICEQTIKVDRHGKLCRHGYKRPGWGHERGRCFGAGYPAHEGSPQAALDYLEQALAPSLGSATGWLTRLAFDEVHTLGIEVRVRDPSSGKMAQLFETIDCTDKRWAKAYGEAMRTAIWRRQDVRGEFWRLSRAVDGWTRKPLRLVGAEVDPLPLSADGVTECGTYRFVNVGPRGMGRLTHYRVELVDGGEKVAFGTMMKAKRAVLERMRAGGYNPYLKETTMKNRNTQNGFTAPNIGRRGDLLEESFSSSAASIRRAMEALPYPDVRDFPTDGEAYEDARREHYARLDKLRKLRDELTEIHQDVVLQLRAR